MRGMPSKEDEGEKRITSGVLAIRAHEFASATERVPNAWRVYLEELLVNISQPNLVR